MARTRPAQAGMTLVELLIAVAIGAIVLAALNSVVSLGLQAQASGRQGNEFVFQARFALERMITTARSVPPQLALATPTAGTTGNWFCSPVPVCNVVNVMYCRNASSELIETTTGDNGCTGTKVIARNVGAFSALLPSSAGPVDAPVAALSLTLTDSAASQTVTLSTSVRLGGGTL
jgi:prepilin-type N-terminal cleavage/methylation domain-containing protein